MQRRIRSILAYSIGVNILIFNTISLPHIGTSWPISQARQASKTPLQHEVSVVLKLIPVHVIDKNGKVIRDLNRDEFTITDDGKSVTITAFEKKEFIRLASGVETLTSQTSDPSGAVSERALNRRFMLLFDFAFNSAHGIVASVTAARHFLETDVKPEDEIALASYSMLKGLRVHEFFTNDHSKIRAALAAITSKDIAGRADEVEQAYWMASDMNFRDNDVVINLEAQRRESAQQALGYFEALTRLARALRLVPGEKNILFFSSGIPSSLVNAGRHTATADPRTVESTSQRSMGWTFDLPSSDLKARQASLLKAFNSSSCSVYSFDTRESAKIPSLFTSDEMASQNRPMGGLLLAADSGGIFRDDKTTGMDSLRLLSKQTGGKYYSNIALHKDNTAEVSSITGTYYVLGYSIPETFDGKFHKISVAVARKGCQVKTQSGYFNPKPFREYTDIEKNIHLFDLALDERSEFQSPIPLSASTLSYDPGEGLKARILTRIAKEVWGQFTGQKAEIVALFFDAQDTLISLQRVTVPLAEYQGKDVLFSAGAGARMGPTKCRVIIRDLDTGRSAVASAIANFGPSSGKALSLFSPLLLVEGVGPFILDGVVKEAAEKLSWRSIYNCEAGDYAPSIGDEPVGKSKVIVVIPYSAPGLRMLDLAIEANLEDSSTGKSLLVPLEVTGCSKSEIIDVFKLEISLEDVSNGSYIINVNISHVALGRVANARVPLVIER